MARLMIPEIFLIQTELFKVVKAKHIIDAAASPLIAFLNQQEIDLADDETAMNAALAFEVARALKEGKSEDFREKRDLIFDPVMTHTHEYYQFLKGFYKPNVAELGNWGAMITVNGKITYPADFLERKAMVAALKVKYDSYDPDPTPLDVYLVRHNLTIAGDNTKAGEAKTAHDAFLQFAGESEEETAARDLQWNPVLEHIHKIGNFLMTLYNDNPKVLALWGFVVDASKRAPKTVVSKVKVLSTKVATNLVIGGTFKNIGSVPLTVYRGKTLTPAGTTIAPGGMLAITKGFSTITVVNASSTTTGVFSTLRGI